MGLFDKLMPQQQQPQQPQQPQQQPQQQQPQQPQQQPQQPDKSKSPLASFDKLWETNDNTTKKAPSFALDSKAVSEMSKQLNFADSIKKEQLTAIAEGGEGAIEAMMGLLNQVAQNTFINTTQTTGHLISKALERNNGYIEETIPEHIKRATVSDKLASSNPGFTDPAVAPMLKLVEQQLLTQFPNASAEEITAQAKEYLNGMADVIKPKEQPKPSAVATSQDFSNYLN